MDILSIRHRAAYESGRKDGQNLIHIWPGSPSPSKKAALQGYTENLLAHLARAETSLLQPNTYNGQQQRKEQQVAYFLGCLHGINDPSKEGA